MHLLDNPAWSALTTHQAHLAVGDASGLALKFPDDVTPIAAIGTVDRATAVALTELVPGGDWMSLPATLPGLDTLLGPPLTITLSKNLVQMVCDARPSVPPSGAELCILSQADSAEMVAL